MPEFRYYCLDGSDRIVSGDDLLVADLNVAIEAAYEACREKRPALSGGIEIWQGTKRPYASEHAGSRRTGDD
jgi:hypothetical protein